jgi:hypothetical protein
MYVSTRHHLACLTPFISDASSAAERRFRQLDALIINQGIERKEITAIRTHYQTTYNYLLLVDEQVSRFEEEHSYEMHWTTGSQQYNDTLALTNERCYCRAIDKLELLVVQQLLELTKLSMSVIGTYHCPLNAVEDPDTCLAYKLHEKIGKALKTRAEAIHCALMEYNAAAGALNPPRDQLIWADVIQTVSLAEFDLLHDMCTDIRRLPWMQPARREAALLYFGIKRQGGDSAP